MAKIYVKQPGMLTTIQDLGRWGFGQFGMPVAGVMDDYAARVANILLGNDENTPVLEMTLLGPCLSFEAETDCVVTGADLQPRLNNQPFPLWSVWHVAAGDTLDFTGVVSGCRAYLAVAGGFDVTPVMGSAATYLRGNLGGYDGRVLRAGDMLSAWAWSGQHFLPDFRLPVEFQPDYREIIRVILGPQDDAFTQRGIETFLSAEYTVTHDADRMGCRLAGPQIEHNDGADIISDGIALGAIQVPASGTPIIMLADRQTTGGYTKIAHVISVDIPSIAQKKPGDRLKFEKISIRDAQHLYRAREKKLDQLKHLMCNSLKAFSRKISYYTVTVNGRQYDISIQEL